MPREPVMVRFNDFTHLLTFNELEGYVIFTEFQEFSGYRYRHLELTISLDIPAILYPPFSMNMSVAWDRLSGRFVKRDLHRTIGRFGLVRKTYSWWQGNIQRSKEHYYRTQLNLHETSIFSDISPEQQAQELRRRSVAMGLQLPAAITDSIHQYASKSPLHEPDFAEEFSVDDIVNGRLPNGRIVMRGLVKDPHRCEAIEQVARDPILMAIARDYLGYWPTQVTRHLTWAFVSPLSEAEQRDRFSPLNYHYDVAGYNFMSAYFYITDMDRLSGAHVMIENSHNQKPWHTLFAPWSGRQTDKQVRDYYGTDRELLIEGSAGLGFVQDPSCFHKLLPPVSHHRLIFQIRYA